MKRLLLLMLLPAAGMTFASCEFSQCDEGYYAVTRQEYSYHYGYNYFNGKFEYHFGPETKTYCYPE